MSSKINVDVLTSLNHQKKIAFCYLISKRVKNNCIVFSKKYRFGSPETFDQTVDLIGLSIFSSIPRTELTEMLNRIGEETASTNQFPNYDGTIATGCGGVIHESLASVINSDNKSLLKDVCTMYTDALDCYIQVRDDMDYEDEDFEDKIANDMVMVGEIELQNKVISYLQNINGFNQEHLDYLISLTSASELDLMSIEE